MMGRGWKLLRLYMSGWVQVPYTPDIQLKARETYEVSNLIDSFMLTMHSIWNRKRFIAHPVPSSSIPLGQSPEKNLCHEHRHLIIIVELRSKPRPNKSCTYIRFLGAFLAPITLSNGSILLRFIENQCRNTQKMLWEPVLRRCMGPTPTRRHQLAHEFQKQHFS